MEPKDVVKTMKNKITHNKNKIQKFMQMPSSVVNATLQIEDMTSPTTKAS